MKNITINIPEFYDQKIQQYIEMGILPSRSEGFRYILRAFVDKEIIKLEEQGWECINE